MRSHWTSPRSRLVAMGLAAVSATLSLACSNCSNASPAPSESASPPSSVQAAPPTTPRALALTRSQGTTPVDVQIATMQAQIEQFPQIRDYWIGLGRLWVRKAREAGDPGFYLHAKACADVALE